MTEPGEKAKALEIAEMARRVFSKPVVHEPDFRVAQMAQAIQAAMDEARVEGAQEEAERCQSIGAIAHLDKLLDKLLDEARAEERAAILEDGRRRWNENTMGECEAAWKDHLDWIEARGDKP